MNSYEDYCAQRAILSGKREILLQQIAAIDREFDKLRDSFVTNCPHPIKVDPRFNVCGVCNNTISN